MTRLVFEPKSVWQSVSLFHHYNASWWQSERHKCFWSKSCWTILKKHSNLTLSNSMYMSVISKSVSITCVPLEVSRLMLLTMCKYPAAGPSAPPTPYNQNFTEILADKWGLLPLVCLLVANSIFKSQSSFWLRLLIKVFILAWTISVNRMSAPSLSLFCGYKGYI